MNNENNSTAEKTRMAYTIKNESAGVKQMTLENGKIYSICKRRTYGNRYNWTIWQDGKHIAAGLTIKECAEDFLRNAKR